MIYNRKCAVCEDETNPESHVVSNELYLCPTCKTFFKEYMRKRMEESNKPKYYPMQNHD